MVTILNVQDKDDIERLREFSKLDHPPTFRYFKNREFEEAIKTHVVTLMYSTYGYAHIDRDTSSGRTYLGVCVLPEYQGKGIGKRLIETLLTLYDKDIYLTVDKENYAAIHIYEKFGFIRINQDDVKYTYKKTKVPKLHVSIGEAIDKLTILDIKMERITHTDKKLQCKKEFDSITLDIANYLDSSRRFYTWLKYINTQIWDLQDDIRESNNYSKEAFHKILDLNDMRFRVKQRINSMFETSFQEQKGYSSKTGLFVTHLGLGDLINMNGAIRYAALMVDTLYVVCKERNMRNVVEMFSDDPTIVVTQCKDDDSDVRDIIVNKKILNKSSIKILQHLSSVPPYVPYFDKQITNTFLSGRWGGRHYFNDIPNNFYDDLKFPREIKHIFAHFTCNNLLVAPNIPYIFTHGSSSCTNSLLFESKWNIDDILTIDPNRNYYSSSHKWFSIAESYVNSPILKYIDVIKYANEIHVTDSSFYCLCCFIETTADVKVCYDRISGIPSSVYKFN